MHRHQMRGQENIPDLVKRDNMAYLAKNFNQPQFFLKEIHLIKVKCYLKLTFMTDSIKIAVRVRPFNEKEINQGAKNIIEMNGQQTRLRHPETNDIKKFGFHRCYYSTDDSMGHAPVNNSFLFNDIGKQILNHIYQGYNSTIFAYGQTGAGKSYSIEGYEEKGLLQMCLEDIFMRKKPENSKNGLATSVRITYLEIYNQKLRDLIDPREKDVRVQQAGTAIFINGVTPVLCDSYEQVERLFIDGKKVRVVGAHAMNKNSSRSHAVFTIYYKETGGGKMIDAKFNIVDLAGSERQSKTGATGQRLEEANNINKSLTNLGIVIEALAKNCQKKQNNFVPYRNSLLTHILSESLCGNSKTFMVAAISPADTNYQQTLSTLRFAQRASMISTNSKKNVQAKEGYNKELLQEIERLKKQLEGAKGQVVHTHSVSVEYITIEKQAEQMDTKISAMMQELDQNKHARDSLQYKLQELQKEKIRIEEEKAKNKLDPETEQRYKNLDKQIENLKKEIQDNKKGRQALQNQLKSEKTKREQLEASLKKAQGDVSEQQKKANELNARIQIMFQELNKNKMDREALEKELEEEKKKKQEMEMHRKKMLQEAGLSQNQQNINEKKNPYIMNVSEDPTLLGMLLYDIKQKETKIGTKQGQENHIKLNVLGIMPRHCTIYYQKDKVYIEPNPEAKVFVNGSIIHKKVQVHHLDRITLGHANNFKLIMPGMGGVDNLKMSSVGSGKYGEYIDDKLAANTIEAKSMKQFLTQLQQRLDKPIFGKFIQKFRNFYQDVDEVNQYTFHRYKKFPLKSKNLFFRINVVIDIQNYMKGIPQLIILCEHKDTKEVQFVWSEDKFQARLADMQEWYEGASKSDSGQSYYEFDPWFDATDSFIREKSNQQNMRAKEIVQFWNTKQQDNAENYKKLLAEQKEILGDLKSMNYSENLVEDYADYYFRNFPCLEGSKKKIEEMRKNEEVHKKIRRFMECCAQVQKCNMDNKFYNDQRQKYAKDSGVKGGDSPVRSNNNNSGGDDGLAQQNAWLNQKLDELQEELKRRTQALNKLKK